MKISLNWLTDYVDVSMSADELAELFTRIGLNCNGVAQHGVGCRVRSGRDLQSAGLPGPFGRGAQAGGGDRCGHASPGRRQVPRKRQGGGTHQRARGRAGSVPAVHRPRDSRREGGRQPQLAGRASGRGGNAERQQRGRRDQFRADGVFAAAAQFRLRQALRTSHRGAAGEGRGNPPGDRRQQVPSQRRHAGDRRRGTSGGGRGRDGRSGQRGHHGDQEHPAGRARSSILCRSGGRRGHWR